MKQSVAWVGWRGMVGSVLLQRMQAESDFQWIDPVLFSTTQAGQPAPDLGQSEPILQDAYDLAVLGSMSIILSCQGSAYTQRIYPRLRARGWQGYWLDMASHLRLVEDSCLVLDPVNQAQITAALDRGIKTFVGGNCTVSLLLMAIAGLLKADLVAWVTAMTYQAISGAGAQAMRTLLAQCMHCSAQFDLAEEALILDQRMATMMAADDFPTAGIDAPLFGNLLPWIDEAVSNGQSREEWKVMVEAQKILQKQPPIPIDGTCVRVATLRCHSQGLTLKLKDDIPLNRIKQLICEAHPWIKWVDNKPSETQLALTPAAVSGTLDIAVGRVRKMVLGPQYLNIFTVGDQLLWGAAEPIRRFLKTLVSGEYV